MIRTRERAISPSSEPSSYSYEYSWGAGADRTSANGNLIVNQWDRMTDTVNPGYFKLKREGGILPVSPMTSEKWRNASIPGMGSSVVRRQYSPSSIYTTTRNFSGVMGDPSDVAWLKRSSSVYALPPPNPALLQQALAYAQTDAWDTATFLAELGKTIESFTTLSGRVRKFYHDFQSKVEKRRLTPAQAASLWLELRYAWRPMIYDVQSMAKAITILAAGVEEPLCRGWAKSDDSPAATTSVVYREACSLLTGNYQSGCTAIGAGGDFVNAIYARSVRQQVQLRASVGVQVTTRVATMFDPAVTSWELVPYSWLLDQVISLGDLIAAFSPFATGRFCYATFASETTISHRIDGNASFRASTPKDTLLSNVPLQSVLNIERTIYNRVPASVTPTLSLHFTYNWTHIVDVVALLVGLRSGISRNLSMNSRTPRPFKYRPPKSKTLSVIKYVRPLSGVIK